MYNILKAIPCQYGNFREGTSDPLTNVPKSVKDSWEQIGLISHQVLPPLPVSPQEEIPEDTKRSTYGRKHK